MQLTRLLHLYFLKCLHSVVSFRFFPIGFGGKELDAPSVDEH